MGREDEAGRCEDGQMISRTDRTDQWDCGRVFTVSDGQATVETCWCTKWSPTLS